jgi:hypothetical protein
VGDKITIGKKTNHFAGNNGRARKIKSNGIRTIENRTWGYYFSTVFLWL